MTIESYCFAVKVAVFRLFLFRQSDVFPAEAESIHRIRLCERSEAIVKLPRYRSGRLQRIASSAAPPRKDEFDLLTQSRAQDYLTFREMAACSSSCGKQPEQKIGWVDVGLACQYEQAAVRRNELAFAVLPGGYG